MAWCRQATSHCLSQGWINSLSPCGVTRPQWVKYRTCPVMLWVCRFSFVIDAFVMACCMLDTKPLQSNQVFYWSQPQAPTSVTIQIITTKYQTQRSLHGIISNSLRNICWSTTCLKISARGDSTNLALKLCLNLSKRRCLMWSFHGRLNLMVYAISCRAQYNQTL